MMVAFLVILLIVLNFAQAYRGKNYSSLYPVNDAVKYAICILTFGGMFVLIGGYRNNSGFSNDLLNLKYEFDLAVRYGESIYEWGFKNVLLLGRYIGDFFVWRNFIIVISLALLAYSNKKWASNSNFATSLFCCYLIILSAEQTRNFFALSVFQIGLLSYLYSENSVKEKIKFICFTLFVSCIHSSFVIFSVLIFYDFICLTMMRRFVFIVLILMFCLLIFFNGNRIPGMEIFLSSFDNERMSTYLLTHTKMGFVLPMILHLIVVVRLWYASTLCPTSKILSAMFKMNFLLMIVFPLYMLQWTFYRIERNVLFVSYIVTSIAFNSVDENSRKRLIFFMAVEVVVWVYVDLFVTTPVDNLLVPFFRDNFYFN